MHRLEFSWTDRSEFLPSARQKLTDTTFKLKNFNDEINSFFMDNYCSKIWNYGAKVCSKWLRERNDDHNIQSDNKYKSGLKVRIQY